MEFWMVRVDLLTDVMQRTGALLLNTEKQVRGMVRHKKYQVLTGMLLKYLSPLRCYITSTGASKNRSASANVGSYLTVDVA